MKKPPEGGLLQDAEASYLEALAADEAGAAAAVAEEAAAVAALAELVAAAAAAEAALAEASAAAGAGAGAAAGAGAGAGAASSFLPQADRARAAIRVAARTSDFFISDSSKG